MSSARIKEVTCFEGTLGAALGTLAADSFHSRSPVSPPLALSRVEGWGVANLKRWLDRERDIAGPWTRPVDSLSLSLSRAFQPRSSWLCNFSSLLKAYFDECLSPVI